MTAPISAAESAGEFGRLAWLNRRLFELIGAASAEPATAQTTVALARHLGEHADRWRSLIPESVLLEPCVGDGPPPGADDLIAAVVEADDVSRAVLDVVVPWLLVTYRELDSRLTDHADGAARRLVRHALGDLATATSRVD